MKIKNISIFIILICLSYNTFANVGFFGSYISTNTLNSNESLFLNYTLINRDNSVKSQISITYELRRISDMSLFFEKQTNYSFDSYEVKKLSEKLNFNNIPSGEYNLKLNLKSGSGTPMSFLNFPINISGVRNDIYFSTLPYLKIYYKYEGGMRERYELSYSNAGKPIIPNSSFEVHFSLNNPNLISQNLTTKFFLKQTYSLVEAKEIFSTNIISNPNSITSYIINYNLSKAGTYDLYVKIYDLNGILVANKEVRVVIMGQGGSILDVFNKADIYKIGENVDLDISIVGPADAVSVVKNGFLKVQIIKNDSIISEETKIIENFAFNPEKLNFILPTSEDLNYYKVKVILGKDKIEYDVVELNYEPLDPKLIINPEGKIYNPNKIACLDDNICTEQENILLNCYDCIAPKIILDEEVLIKEENFENKSILTENLSKEDNFSSKLSYILLALLIIAIIVIWRIKNEKK